MSRRVFVAFGALLALACSPDVPTDAQICPDPACAGHGECSVESLRPVCACDEGYTGAACSLCADGFERDAAAPDTCVARAEESCQSDSCPANAACSDGDGIVSCACNEPFVGADCTMCGPGWASDGAGACVLVQRCAVHTCSGHGTCSGEGAAIACACDPGFEGEFCDELVDGCAALDPCGEHGTCVGEDGTARCRCDLGYTGALCDTCYPGYAVGTEGQCELEPSCPASACSGAGTCSAATGSAVCTCDPGYAGDSCERCDTGSHRDGNGACVADESCVTDDPCSTNGTCDDATGEARCACAAGYAGATCEECFPGFRMDESGACVLAIECDGFICNGGSCADDTGIVVCSECPDGFSGDYCETNDDDCTHNACGTGRCVDLVSGSLCLCLDGSFGSECP